MRLLLLLTLFLTPPVTATKQCEVHAAPRITLAPARYIRVKVTDQNRAGGRLQLDGPDGMETSSAIQPGPVTTWVEWKSLVLGPGVYEVVFVTAGCVARETVTVSGGEPVT